jgi:type I restriction enzyme S subunit
MTIASIDTATAELDLDRSDWELVSFGDVAKKQNASVDRENTDLTRYIAGEHMGSEDLHLREWGELGDDYLGPAFTRKFCEGDILYGSRRTYLRKVAVAHFDGITANTTFVIKPNEELIQKELLPFVMLSEGFTQHSIRNSKGSVNPYINWKDIANYEFLLPPKDQQAILAELLWAADAAVESHAAIDDGVQSAMAALFRETISESFEDTPLSEVGQVVTGATPPTKNKAFWDGGSVPFVTPADFKDSPYIESVERTITPAGMESVRPLPENTVLVVSIGTIGKVAISSSECATNQQINAIIPHADFSPVYVMQALRIFKHRILARSGATTLPIINKGEFSKVRIPRIGRDKSIQFQEGFRSIEAARAASLVRARNLRQLLKSLINQIF